MNILKRLAKVKKGIDPFMNLSFVSLAVIGDVRLLPGGAFDVKKWRFITEEDLQKKKKTPGVPNPKGTTQSDSEGRWKINKMDNKKLHSSAIFFIVLLNKLKNKNINVILFIDYR